MFCVAVKVLDRMGHASYTVVFSCQKVLCVFCTMLWKTLNGQYNSKD